MSPLALYIHWPFCKAKCPYCDFNSHVRERVDQLAWQEALLAELAHMVALTPGRRVSSIFFGGGTPSLMPPATAAALIEAAEAAWGLAEGVEITLEANPTSVEAEKFRGFRAAGVNRVSLGVQALNQADLTFLGRQHDVSEALAAVELAASIFPRYSFDLIYVRPGQTVAGWEAELRRALRFAGEHLSLYQLTIEENTAFHHAYGKGAFALPEEESAAQMYELTQEIMEAAGLPAYEISNHARPGAESRHNLAYWRGEEYAGIGPGAHGRISLMPHSTPPGDRGVDSVLESSCTPLYTPVLCAESSIAPSGGANDPRGRAKCIVRHATETLKSPELWLEQVKREGHGISVKTALSAREHLEEVLMMGLRLREGIDLDAFARRTGVRLQQAVSSRHYQILLGEGLLEETPTHLRATAAGRLVLTALLGQLLS